MKIYTKTGDDGTTSLIGGVRISKTDRRIEAYGTIDELNSHIGVLRTYWSVNTYKTQLIEIQNVLFSIGGYLATPDGTESPVNISDKDVSVIEQAIDALEVDMPKQIGFILPGGTPASAYCHVVRTVCRRAERCILRVSAEENIDINIRRYINRLSDYFFVLARHLSADEGEAEIIWKFCK